MILEHRDKTIAWVGGINDKISYDCNLNQTPKEESKGEIETKVVVS